MLLCIAFAAFSYACGVGGEGGEREASGQSPQLLCVPFSLAGYSGEPPPFSSLSSPTGYWADRLDAWVQSLALLPFCLYTGSKLFEAKIVSHLLSAAPGRTVHWPHLGNISITKDIRSHRKYERTVWWRYKKRNAVLACLAKHHVQDPELRSSTFFSCYSFAPCFERTHWSLGRIW